MYVQKLDAKDILQKAMFQLMKKKTIEKITVEEIIASCDVSRATFYRNFRDKYDLMHYCYQSTVDNFIANIKSDNWEEILVDIFSFLKGYKTFFTNAIKTRGDNSFLDFLYDYSYRFYEEQMLARLGMSELTQEDHDCIAFNCSGAVWLVELWIRRNMKEPPEQMARWSYQFMPPKLQEFF